MWSYLKRKVCSDAIASLCIYQYGCSQKIVQDSEICADSEIARANIKISIILKFFQTHYCSKLGKQQKENHPNRNGTKAILFMFNLAISFRKLQRGTRDLYIFTGQNIQQMHREIVSRRILSVYHNV